MDLFGKARKLNSELADSLAIATKKLAECAAERQALVLELARVRRDAEVVEGRIRVATGNGEELRQMIRGAREALTKEGTSQQRRIREALKVLPDLPL